jgi:hypothetical protein
LGIRCIVEGTFNIQSGSNILLTRGLSGGDIDMGKPIIRSSSLGLTPANVNITSLSLGKFATFITQLDVSRQDNNGGLAIITVMDLTLNCKIQIDLVNGVNDQLRDSQFVLFTFNGT